jgi:dihydroorotate dehydrogenase
VQVGTAHFVDPRATERLVKGLEGWCRDNRAPEISKLRGSIEVAGTGSK